MINRWLRWLSAAAWAAGLACGAAVAAPPVDTVAAFESAHENLLRRGKGISARALAEGVARRGEAAGDFGLARAARLALAETSTQVGLDGGVRARAAVDTLQRDPSPASRAKLEMARALAVTQARGPFKDGMAHALAAVDAAREHGDPDDALRSLILAWEISTAAGNNALAEHYGRLAMQVSGVAADSRRRIQMALNHAVILKFLGRKAESRQLTDQAMQLARAAGDLDSESIAHLRLSTFAASPVEALAEQEKQVALSSQFEDQWRLVQALVDISDQQMRAGLPQQALASADRALFAMESLPAPAGPADYRGLARFNKGWALNRMGRHAEGLQLIDLALQDDPAGGGDAAQEFAFAGRHREAYERLAAYMAWKAKRATEATGVSKVSNDVAQEHLARVEAESRLAQANQRLTLALASAAGLLALAIMLGLALRQRLLQRHARHLARMNEQLETLAQTDALTGLHNRHHFMAQIGRHVAAADRSHSSTTPLEPRTDLTFFVIDLDHFKRVNDELGHAAGDAVLKQAAVRLASLVRTEDELVRWGGEEFLLMTRGTGASGAHALAERIRTAIAGAPFELPSGALSVSCSIGFASYPVAPHAVGVPDWQGVVELADQALYRVKAHGRNGWSGVAAVREPLASVAVNSLATGIEQGTVVVADSFAADPAAQPAGQPADGLSPSFRPATA